MLTTPVELGPLFRSNTSLPVVPTALEPLWANTGGRSNNSWDGMIQKFYIPLSIRRMTRDHHFENCNRQFIGSSCMTTLFFGSSRNSFLTKTNCLIAAHKDPAQDHLFSRFLNFFLGYALHSRGRRGGMFPHKLHQAWKCLKSRKWDLFSILWFYDPDMISIWYRGCIASLRFTRPFNWGPMGKKAGAGRSERGDKDIHRLVDRACEWSLGPDILEINPWDLFSIHFQAVQVTSCNRVMKTFK